MIETMPPLNVTEARKRPRFRMTTEIRATFAGAPAVVTNLSAEGLALRHEALMKVGSTGAIRIESEENTADVAFRGRIRWSHISSTTSPTGGLLYDSGIQIEDTTDAVAGLLGRLIRAHGEKDADSMRRKQEAAEQRAKNRSATVTAPAAPAPTRTVTRDQILLIREARATLDSSPDNAQQLFERARQSLAKRTDVPGRAAALGRRDVLSVWEYLGCTVELDVITAVLDARQA